MKRELTAAIVFSSLTGQLWHCFPPEGTLLNPASAGFDLMRNTVQTMIYTVPDLLTGTIPALLSHTDSERNPQQTFLSSEFKTSSTKYVILSSLSQSDDNSALD